MIVISLLSLLSLAGLPSLHASIKRAQAQQASNTILKAFDLAREEAIAKNHTVTLCGIVNQQCTSRGQLTLSIFIDENQNRVIDDNEEVVRVLSKPVDDGELLIKASLGRNYFRFKGNGTAMEAGTIVYCPTANEIQTKSYMQIIKLNYTGRAYLLRDEKEKEKQIC